LYASSAATYGDGENGFDDALELSRLKPLNLYGKSKHDFDLWVEEQVRLQVPQPVQSVGFKFFNVFGPGEGHKGRMASMVWHGYHQILKEGSVRLFESHRPDYAHGGQLRDFIYVKDVVRVMLSFAERREVSGLFNLGTGQARSFRDLIEATFAALASEFSEGPERETGGLLGPIPLNQLHPGMAKLLQVSRPGQLWPPRALQGWAMIVRLELLQGAIFDPAMQQRLLLEEGERAIAQLLQNR
jgi:nucleoside-diphosphate-sugar epimerase